MSDKIQETILEQLAMLTESVQEIAHGQKRLEDTVVSLDDKVSSLDEKVGRLDDKVSSLDEKVVSLDDKVSSLDEKVVSLDDKVSSLDEKVGRLDDKVTQVEENVSCLGKNLGQVYEKVNRVEKTVARIENVHGEKIGALFDAFHLRGDQITELKEHLDGRLDSLQTSINFLIHRTNEHDNELIRLRKVK
ncbi:MAG: Chromosome partition protein Smc [Firmicutes bacterium]|nr:Chromosome partition protein Smc [Bacillota bacterium]